MQLKITSTDGSSDHIINLHGGEGYPTWNDSALRAFADDLDMDTVTPVHTDADPTRLVLHYVDHHGLHTWVTHEAMPLERVADTDPACLELQEEATGWFIQTCEYHPNAMDGLPLGAVPVGTCVYLQRAWLDEMCTVPVADDPAYTGVCRDCLCKQIQAYYDGSPAYQGVIGWSVR